MCPARTHASSRIRKRWRSGSILDERGSTLNPSYGHPRTFRGLTLIRVFRKHLILHGWNCGSAIALLRTPRKTKGEYEMRRLLPLLVVLSVVGSAYAQGLKNQLAERRDH